MNYLLTSESTINHDKFLKKRGEKTANYFLSGRKDYE